MTTEERLASLPTDGHIRYWRMRTGREYVWTAFWWDADGKRRKRVLGSTLPEQRPDHPCQHPEKQSWRKATTEAELQVAQERGRRANALRKVRANQYGKWAPTKVCYDCQQTRPLADFQHDASRADGYKYFCRICAARRRSQAEPQMPHLVSAEVIEAELSRLHLDIQVRASMIEGLRAISQRQPGRDPVVRGWLRILEAEQQADWAQVRKLRGQRSRLVERAG